MLVRTFFKWLLLLLMLGALSACGGGSDGNTSNLLSDSGSDTGSSSGGTTDSTTTGNLSYYLAGPAVIPLGTDRAEYSLTIFEEISDSATSLTPTVAGVRMNLTVTGSAYFASNGLKSIDLTSDGSGEAFFTLIDPVEEQVLLSLRATGNYEGGGTDAIYFGATANVVLSSSSVPADGTSATTLLANLVDFYGNPLEGISVSVSTPNSFATVAEPTGTIDEQGKFTTTISNTIAEVVQVRTSVGGISFLDIVTFSGSTSGTGGNAVASIDLLIKTNNVAPDGSAEASLVVVPRNSAGVPIRNVTVGVSSDSATANMFIPGGSSGQFFVSGNSGSSGSFTVNITNTVAETVKISASYDDGTNSASTDEPAAIVFQSATTDDGTTVAGITLEDPVSSASSVTANGQDRFTVSGRVVDSNDAPVANVSVSLITTGGSATFPANVTTNSAGIFSANFTNTVAETIGVRAVLGSVSSELKSLTFSAVTATDTGVDIPSTLTLLASPQQQSIGGNITLTAIARDANQSPLSGVQLVVSAQGSTANSAVFSTIVETGSNGSVTFDVTNTVAGSIAVSVVALAGGPSATQTVTFVDENSTTTTATPTTLNLISDTQQQVINSSVALTAIALDENQAPLSGVKLNVSVQGDTASSAIFDFSSSNNLTTSDNGTITFSVSNSIAGAFAVVIQAESGGPSATRSLSFTSDSNTGAEVARLDVSVRNNNAPADGDTAIIVEVVALTSGGEAIPEVAITLLSDSGNGGATKIAPLESKTDNNGFYTASVTSSTAGTVKLTVLADNLLTDPPVVELNFTASSSVTPDSIEVTAEPTSQLADGSSEVVLVVTPRDASGSPIAGVEVELVVTSANFSNLTIENAQGTTNAIGEFRTVATSSQADTYTIKPVVMNQTLPDAKSPAIDVVFTAVEGRELDQLVLTVVGNNQAASLENEVQLLTLARATDGSPLGSIDVMLRITAASTGVDVSNSVVFNAETGFQGITLASTGIFSTMVSNPQPGTFQVQAFEVLTGGQTGLSSNIVSVTFLTPTGGTPDVSTLTLLTDRTQINSADGTDTGATITALVRDDANNPVSEATVSFSSDSGEIQPIQIDGSSSAAGVTDASGRAQALLTSATDKDNRTITVTAQVTRPSGEVLEQSLTVDVVGTTLNIVGNSSVTIGDVPVFTVTLKDSAGVGIAGQSLQVDVTRTDGSLASFVGAVGAGSQSSTTTVTTNSLGQADVEVITSTAGTDTITVSRPAAPAISSASATLTVSGDTLTVTPTGSNALCTSIGTNTETSSPLCQIALNETQTFNIVWTSSGQTVTGTGGEVIEISATRGALNRTSISAPFVLPGETAANFTISADNTGVSKIVVRGNRQTGVDPTVEFNVEFVATTPDNITIQANPSVISTNQSGSTTQQSEVVAVVRDANGNLVKDVTVNFNLQDITGGYLTRSAVTTNSFGEATTTYIAGSTSSAADGVVVTAAVEGISSAQVKMTVAQRSVFVSVASGNVISKSDNNTRYLVPHTVLVTDSNGTPVSNASVTLSVYTEEYYRLGSDGLSLYLCTNEDVNRNGVLDAGEDLDGNGKLDPGNVITVDNLTLTTDETGFSDFNVVYAIQYATWVSSTELTARTSVAGSESRTSVPVVAVCSAPDVEDEICPVSNPFEPLATGNSACTAFCVLDPLTGECS